MVVISFEFDVAGDDVFGGPYRLTIRSSPRSRSEAGGSPESIKPTSRCLPSERRPDLTDPDLMIC